MFTHIIPQVRRQSKTTPCVLDISLRSIYVEVDESVRAYPGGFSRGDRGDDGEDLLVGFVGRRILSEMECAL